MLYFCCLNHTKEQLSWGTISFCDRAANSFTVCSTGCAVSLLVMTALFLLYDHMGKLCRNNLKQTVPWYNAALLLQSLKLFHMKYYHCINKNSWANFFKMLSSKRSLLRAVSSQETLARWFVTLRQHAVTNPLGFMDLFKLDICRQCIIYNQKHE